MKYLITIMLLLSFSCNKAETPEEPILPEKGEPIEGIRIAWNQSSLQKLAPQNGRFLSWVGYPRLKRIDSGSIMATYETEGNIELIQSHDNGITWTTPSVVFASHTFSNTQGESTIVNKANGELIQLHNGDLVMACNYRPAKDNITPFAIAVKRSTDKGLTWSESQIIYEAGPRFADGCWEPALLQLPSGELQVYFANESPYTQTDEQEISMLTSHDNGITWDRQPKTICFRAGRRDGMPVPILLNNEILVAIEDNNIESFKPYIVRSDLSDNWSAIVSGNSPKREYALKDVLPNNIYAGAPYLLKVPSGEVILSYQTTENRSSNWELSTMAVAIGNKEGRHFQKKTNPFKVPLNKEAKWNSLMLWDENTIVASSTTNYKSDNCEVWIIKGHIIPELKASVGTPLIDGKLDIDEWTEYFPVFVGHQGPSNLKAAFRYDEDNLYLGIKVLDESILSSAQSQLQSNGVTINIDAHNHCLTAPYKGLYKIWSNYNGEILLYEGFNGKWKEKQQNTNTIISKTRIDGNYYIMELSIPFSSLEKSDRSNIRVNVGLKTHLNASTQYVESVVHANPEASNTWCSLTFD